MTVITIKQYIVIYVFILKSFWEIVFNTSNLFLEFIFKNQTNLSLTDLLLYLPRADIYRLSYVLQL
jgi:hypothetical protein